jgi:hypothetical protein
MRSVVLEEAVQVRSRRSDPSLRMLALRLEIYLGTFERHPQTPGVPVCLISHHNIGVSSEP